jgi:hypothetical protein
LPKTSAPCVQNGLRSTIVDDRSNADEADDADAGVALQEWDGRWNELLGLRCHQRREQAD